MTGRKRSASQPKSRKEMTDAATQVSSHPLSADGEKQSSVLSSESDRQQSIINAPPVAAKNRNQKNTDDGKEAKDILEVLPIFSPFLTSSQTKRQYGWAAVCLYRIVLAVWLIRTADVPDEWYQSTEVAYTWLYGKGQYTWEWYAGIRSFMYPLPFAFAFKALALIGLDTPWMFWAVPKAMAGLVVFLIDYSTFDLASFLFGDRVGRCALFLCLTNWWVGFLGCRTQSNVVEALVLLCALRQTSFVKYLLWAGLGCALRITVILPMLGPALSFLREARHTSGLRGLSTALFTALVMVGFWLGFIATVDYGFYGRWLCSPIAFLQFNFFQGLSELFGVHTWHWYVTEVFPTEIGPGHLFIVPFALHLCYLSMRNREDRSEQQQQPDRAGGDKVFSSLLSRNEAAKVRHLLSIVVLTTVGYSFLAHKELRFVFPLIPLLLIVLAVVMEKHPMLRKRRYRLILLGFMTLCNLIMFSIFSIAFQRGTLDVMGYLRQTTAADWTVSSDSTDTPAGRTPQPPPGTPGRVAVDRSLHSLMNCHSLPGYSYVHGVVDEFLHTNCALTLHPRTRKRLATEQTLFGTNATAFVQWIYFKEKPRGSDPAAVQLRSIIDEMVETPGYQGFRRLPKRLVMFPRAARELNNTFLVPNGYKLEFSMYHTFFVADPEFDHTIEIWIHR